MKAIFLLTGLLTLHGIHFVHAQGVHEIVVDVKQYHQTMEGFGASDCWTVQYIGKYWDDIEKQKAAKLLFSNQMNRKGNPQGIGLSIWRINLGAGTIEQGDSGGIKDITRRAECFIDSTGNYDWSKQIGQQWFVSAAKKYGCTSFVLFANSAPVWYTRNGFGFANKGDESSNLRADCYDDFADYLCRIATYFNKKKKIHVTYISPINEPQWKWDSDYQEGSPWTNEEIKKMVFALDSKIKKYKLKSKIAITEAGTWEALYRKEGRAFNQIRSFFDPQSDLYLGNLKSLPHEIIAHSYWTDSNNEVMKDIRSKVKKTADEYGLKVIQSEWSMLTNPPIDNFPGDYREATHNDIALHMAKVIYADIVYAGVASWSFWTSMDVEMYGFKNRFNLIRLHTKMDKTSTIMEGGYVSATKTLWMLGNYSRFVKPGYVRLHTHGAENMNSVIGTAYAAPKEKQIVLVLTNISTNTEEISIVLQNTGKKKYKKISMYTTDETRNLDFTDGSKFAESGRYVLPARSTVTIVFE